MGCCLSFGLAHLYYADVSITIIFQERVTTDGSTETLGRWLVGVPVGGQWYDDVGAVLTNKAYDDAANGFW
ncbi:unnamed protein product [Ceratitis capitata]|uniref:(Mediterranean fruit fly) hypothetical protein n=1 Tax=Ceratitis capitata TaxID=7213 RepID=A0A811VIJ8_CERCA|nr:unnamed protein product [Ceratitis capitata]